MKKYILHTLTLILLSACSGDIDFLDERPDKSRVVPESLEDLQALFENTDLMNSTPALGLLGSDDLFVTEEGYGRFSSATVQNAYIWSDEIYEGESPWGWSRSYQQIFYSNVVLDYLKKRQETTETNRMKGAAYFYKAYAYFQLLQLFAPPYDESTADTDLGVPIKKTIKVNENPVRSTVSQCYEQILSDLTMGLDLLEDFDPYKNRPCKFAAYALLSRSFLFLEDYASAVEWGEQVLSGPYSLINYNQIDSTAVLPFPKYNDEVIYHSELSTYEFSFRPRTLVDTALLSKYYESDLRKVLYFWDRGHGNIFNGQYTGNVRWFSGLALDEVYLTVAESHIRMGNIGEGMDVLNELLVTRWKEGEYIPYEANTEEKALRIVLEERRKSLLFRGINWMDLRRLNQDPRFARTLRRTIKGETYELPPNDPRYVYPIPDDEIRYNPVVQNER